MTAIGLHFSSDDDDIAGTGFMAGYATYEGTISGDYYYNSWHKVTCTGGQDGFWYTQWCNFEQFDDL